MREYFLNNYHFEFNNAQAYFFLPILFLYKSLCFDKLFNVISSNSKALTVSGKIVRSFMKILTIFLWFDCRFLSSYACTLDSKIIRALEISSVKTFISNAIL